MKYYIINTTAGDDKEYYHLCDIAFDAGKGYCGVIFSNEKAVEVGVYGKWSDAVRVYAALKNNGFVCTLGEDKF